MVNVLSKFTPVPSRCTGLSLQKSGALLAASVSSDAHGQFTVHLGVACFCSHASWEPSSQAEDLEKLGVELKGAVPSSAQRGGAGRQRQPCHHPAHTERTQDLVSKQRLSNLIILWITLLTKKRHIE